MEIVDFMGDNFAYVGTRATGTKAGNYAIVGPDWKGTLPEGVQPLASVLDTMGDDPRPHLREGRIRSRRRPQGSGPSKLTPLSQWGKAEVIPPKDAVIWQAFDPKADPLADWKTINRAMIEVPPPARDADMLQQFARIGVGPGLDVEAQDASTKRGLARAAVDGKKIIAQAFTDGYLQKVVNGWNYPPPATGRPSPTRDWLFRDVQMLAGFVANDPVEATYLNVSVDGDGKPLTGKNRLRHPFRQGRRAEGQGVLVGDDVQPRNTISSPIRSTAIRSATAVA